LSYVRLTSKYYITVTSLAKYDIDARAILAHGMTDSPVNLIAGLFYGLDEIEFPAAAFYCRFRNRLD